MAYRDSLRCYTLPLCIGSLCRRMDRTSICRLRWDHSPQLPQLGSSNPSEHVISTSFFCDRSNWYATYWAWPNVRNASTDTGSARLHHRRSSFRSHTFGSSHVFRRRRRCFPRYRCGCGCDGRSKNDNRRHQDDRNCVAHLEQGFYDNDREVIVNTEGMFVFSLG